MCAAILDHCRRLTFFTYASHSHNCLCMWYLKWLFWWLWSSSFQEIWYKKFSRNFSWIFVFIGKLQVNNYEFFQLSLTYDWFIWNVSGKENFDDRMGVKNSWFPYSLENGQSLEKIGKRIKKEKKNPLCFRSWRSLNWLNFDTMQIQTNAGVIQTSVDRAVSASTPWDHTGVAVRQDSESLEADVSVSCFNWRGNGAI